MYPTKKFISNKTFDEGTLLFNNGNGIFTIKISELAEHVDDFIGIVKSQIGKEVEYYIPSEK